MFRKSGFWQWFAITSRKKRRGKKVSKEDSYTLLSWLSTICKRWKLPCIFYSHDLKNFTSSIVQVSFENFQLFATFFTSLKSSRVKKIFKCIWLRDSHNTSSRFTINLKRISFYSCSTRLLILFEAQINLRGKLLYSMKWYDRRLWGDVLLDR